MAFKNGLFVILFMIHLTRASFYEKAEQILKGYNLKGENPEGKAVTTSFFLTNVNHFHPENSSTLFYNRFAYNDEFSVEGGPIIIFVGGQAVLDTTWLNFGLAYDVAAELGGTLFSIEQRFFGPTRPTPDISFESLQYHWYTQYIEDIRVFIEAIRDFFPNHRNSRVLLVGTGIGGSAAVWFTHTHPDLVDGTWAVTAPIRGMFDMFEYNEAVGEILIANSGESCFNRVLDGFVEIERIFKDRNFEEIYALKDDFNSCSHIEGEWDLEHFSFGLSLLIAIVTSAGSPSDVVQLCDGLTGNPLHTGYESLSEMAKTFDFFGIVAADGCYDWVYESYINRFKFDEWESPLNVGGRQGIYQRCTQIGWFGTTNTTRSVFANTMPIEYYIAQCIDVFEKEFILEDMRQAIDGDFNARFGGITPKVQNTIFTAGINNNYRNTVVKEDLNESAFAIMIPGENAASELLSISDDDSLQLRQTKERVRELLIQWAAIAQ